MSRKPIISIITVVFNGEKYLEQTILSVIKNKSPEVEYVIIDGGSTDGTLDIIERYKDEIDQCISEQDKGLYDAMNKGIHISSGKYIGIVNSDDWLEEHALENVINVIKKGANEDVLYGYLRVIDDDKEFIVSRKSHEFINKEMIHHPSCFISKICYEKLGGYDTNYKVSADYDLLLKLFNNNVTFKGIDYIISNFRTGGVSSTLNGVIETIKVKEKYGIKVSKKLKVKAYVYKMISWVYNASFK
jgi:glycosyltransferase involved in cell wall biosynthesis